MSICPAPSIGGCIPREHLPPLGLLCVGGSLIFVDLITGFSPRVLKGDISTRRKGIPMVIDDLTITLAGEPAKIGVNPITMDLIFNI